jgi:hypothetical protein
MDPTNYMLNFTPAVQAAMAGYQGGLQRQSDQASQALQAQQAQLGMDATRQTMGLQAQQAGQQATLFDQGQQDRAAAQAAQAQADQRNAAAQQAMAALAQNPSASFEDYTAVMAQFPEIKDALKSNWDMLDTHKQEAAKAYTAQLFAAVSSGNADVAKKLLQDRVDAAKNSGDPQSVMESQHMMDILDHPDGVASLKTALGMQLAATLPAEQMVSMMKMLQPEGPLSPEGKLAADKAAGYDVAIGPDWRTATPAELADHPGAAAGQVNTKTGEFKADSVPQGMTLTTNPNGGMTLTQGALGVAAPKASVNATDPQFMIDTIDSVLNDPALPTATGAMALTQYLPGTPMYRFGTKAAQLKGQAFLQAYQGLKGSGAITEQEGAKATDAIARLDTAQSPEDYKAALTELRDILVAAQKRASAGTPSASGMVYDVTDQASFDAVPSGGRIRYSDGSTGVKK